MITLADRLRKIREYRGLKQSAVAQEMNVSQQAYSCLETKGANIKMETIQRFCNAMKIEVSFLLALDIPVNDENLHIFEQKNMAQVVEDYKKMSYRLSVYEDLLSRDVFSINKAQQTAH